MVEIDREKPMKLETSPKVTKSKRSLHWCRSISKKYLCRFYYSISQKVITLSGRRFITVSGVVLHYRAVITLSGVFYYIIGQLLQYRAFITLSVGTSVNVDCDRSARAGWYNGSMSQRYCGACLWIARYVCDRILCSIRQLQPLVQPHEIVRIMCCGQAWRVDCTGNHYQLSTRSPHMVLHSACKCEHSC